MHEVQEAVLTKTFLNINFLKLTIVFALLNIQATHDNILFV